MSVLKEILTQGQLVKHYEVLQYLAKHPNEEYTLAQLDYYLPRGASVQHFPQEWIDYVESGELGRNVELYYRLAGEGEMEGDDKRHQVVLVTRRPHIHSVETLRALVLPPSAVADPEACAGLHTDQIIITPQLLRQAQRAGILYFFPEKYNKADATSFGLRRIEQGGKQRTVMHLGEALEELMRKGDAELGKNQGITSTFLGLPPGIRVRYKLFTCRGVVARDDYCVPVQLRAGERALVTLDNITAVSQGRDGQLNVQQRFTGLSNEVLQDGPPLRVRVKKMTIPISKKMDGSTCGVPDQSDSINGTRTAATQVVLELRAVRQASFKWILEVNGEENVVNMRIMDDDATMPGVMIGREREPSLFTLPEEYTLRDPLVYPPALALAEPKNAVVVEEPLPDGAVAAGPSSDELNQQKKFSPYLLPLPWWQNSSPLVHAVRDATYPSSDTVTAAASFVFTKKALEQEEQLRAARLRHRQQEWAMEQRSGKMKRHRTRSNQELRNCHLLHFGLDASVPFKADA